MARRTQRNVGVIGLGIIGRRVADCVRRAGFPTFVWNRTPRPFPNFVGSPAEIAELCDFIQIFVSDDEALLQVVQRMKQSLGSHHIILAHSTVSPATTRAAAEMIQRRGAQLLDAPFTGSKLAAEKGELVYYIGGDDAAYRRARPVLEASSKEIIEIGEIGQATTIKIATNMITAATVQVAAEALALVHSSGLPLEKFVEAMQGNGSNSGTLKMKLPKMLQGDYEPHFSVKHMLKDVEIASRLGLAYGLSLPATEAARDSLLSEARQGRTDDDYSSITRGFFPHGAPGKMDLKAENEEEQSVLAGLDERASGMAIVAQADETAARNGHATAEVSKEEIRREELVVVKPEEAKAQKEEIPEKKPEEPVEAKREEAVVEKIEEPVKRDEEVSDKQEKPVEEKIEEPIVAKSEEAIDEKRADSIEEKPAEPAAATVEKTEPEKIEPLIEQKREEPPKDLVAEKVEEPVAAKLEGTEPKKIETLIEEKREPRREEPPKDVVPEKVEEPVAVKVAPQPVEKREEFPLKMEELSKPIARVKRITADEDEKDEKEEDVAPRRSFLSRLFGKTSDD